MNETWSVLLDGAPVADCATETVRAARAAARQAFVAYRTRSLVSIYSSARVKASLERQGPSVEARRMGRLESGDRVAAQQSAREVVETVHERLLRVRVELER